jgi:hypothetical protein
MMCVNTKGASKLLGVSTVTIWRWSVSRRLHSFSFGLHTLIPLGDIAKELQTTQGKLTKEADSRNIPLWRVKK